MEHMDEAARHREAVALAELIKVFAGMFLMAAVGCLLLGGYGFDRDRKVRNAMEKAVATAPLAQPLYVLAAGGLCLALGGIGMFGQVYLRGKHANPWHEGEE